jgi:hypothetical protein
MLNVGMRFIIFIIQIPPKTERRETADMLHQSDRQLKGIKEL